jgi:hypothetical protein
VKRQMSKRSEAAHEVPQNESSPFPYL